MRPGRVRQHHRKGRAPRPHFSGRKYPGGGGRRPTGAAPPPARRRRADLRAARAAKPRRAAPEIHPRPRPPIRC